MASIEGTWRVERLGGVLPPMVGVWKRIVRNRGETYGETWIGPTPVWPFRCERREGVIALVYRRPFSGLVDELHPEPDGSWTGRSTLFGRELGIFRMFPIDYPKETRN